MSARTLVVVFFFWALLTFITPSLVQLSESHKIKSKLDGEKKMIEAMRPRKVLDYVRRRVVQRAPTQSEKSPAKSIASPPAPAPAPGQMIRPIRKTGSVKQPS
ncbi:hypothetical protein MLD38_034966 [Melastoma candidum]|uniref:Uncharacterized protein n=1 Tax=Melastoma candidum TaxID=119954 RepID=A0ACB9MDI6_9MYRT|nr:hypothetical protein MLD38_034966 [Melastoma candidum]